MIYIKICITKLSITSNGGVCLSLDPRMAILVHPVRTVTGHHLCIWKITNEITRTRAIGAFVFLWSSKQEKRNWFFTGDGLSLQTSGQNVVVALNVSVSCSHGSVYLSWRHLSPSNSGMQIPAAVPITTTMTTDMHAKQAHLRRPVTLVSFAFEKKNKEKILIQI